MTANTLNELSSSHMRESKGYLRIDSRLPVNGAELLNIYYVLTND